MSAHGRTSTTHPAIHERALTERPANAWRGTRTVARRTLTHLRGVWPGHPRIVLVASAPRHAGDMLSLDIAVMAMTSSRIRGSCFSTCEAFSG
jgi:hypothetical protein